MSDSDPAGEPLPSAAPYVLRINGAEHSVPESWVGESLLYVLRERLGLPGSKNACEQGECGSCTVLIDGAPVCACLELAAACTGIEITTVEALAGPPEGDDLLTDVQRSLLEAGGVQCGFCTPGFVVAMHQLLDANPEPTDLEMREALSGNLCRCTGYGRIFEAMRSVVEIRRVNAAGES